MTEMFWLGSLLLEESNSLTSDETVVTADLTVWRILKTVMCQSNEQKL